MVTQEKMDAILSVLGGRIGIDVALGVGQTATPPPATQPVQGSNPPGIAVIPIYGTLAKRVGGVQAASGLTSYATLTETILDAATDPSVQGILLDIDSQGGEVGGVFELAALIKDAASAKPIWAVANSAFSAAYLLASAAQRIYMPQTAGVGGIGVLAVHIDETQADAKAGRQYTTIFAGDHKTDFSPHAPLTTGAKAIMQTEVDRLYGIFVTTVAANRNLSVDAVKATQAGSFFGDNAIKVGLVDQIGGVRDAVTELLAALSNRSTSAIFKGNRMGNNATPTAQTEKPTEPVAAPTTTTASTTAIDADAIIAAGKKQFQTDAQGIVDLCSLANLPALAGGYIAKGMGMEEVRNELMVRRAAGPEIHSHVMPGDGTNTQAAADMASNPVVLSCKRIAQQISGKSGG